MDAGTEREFTDFVAAYTGALFRAAYALTGNQHSAEDLLQTALAKALTRWPKIRGDAAPYVRRILYHDHISGWRRRRSRPEVTVADLPDLPFLDRDAGDDTHDRMLVREALLSLPPRQRAVLVLRYLEDLSERQVAEALRCSPGTVASQASRALAKLRERAAAAGPPAPAASPERRTAR